MYSTHPIRDSGFRAVEQTNPFYRCDLPEGLDLRPPKYRSWIDTSRGRVSMLSPFGVRIRNSGAFRSGKGSFRDLDIKGHVIDGMSPFFSKVSISFTRIPLFFFFSTEFEFRSAQTSPTRAHARALLLDFTVKERRTAREERTTTGRDVWVES